jgi:hypothetical protein
MRASPQDQTTYAAGREFRRSLARSFGSRILALPATRAQPGGFDAIVA